MSGEPMELPSPVLVPRGYSYDGRDLLKAFGLAEKSAASIPSPKKEVGAVGGMRMNYLLAGASMLWPKTEEAAPSAGWSMLDLEIARRKDAGTAFAQAAIGINGVESIWLTDVVDDLQMVVVLDPTELEQELEVRRIFIDLMCKKLDPSVGELYAYPGDEVPQWVEDDGTKLA